MDEKNGKELEFFGSITNREDLSKNFMLTRIVLNSYI